MLWHKYYSMHRTDYHAMSNATVLHNKIDSYVAGMYKFTHTRTGAQLPDAVQQTFYLSTHTHMHLRVILGVSTNSTFLEQIPMR